MATATKVDQKKAANAAKNKLKNNPATKAVSDLFSKIGKKTGVDKKKVDEWQKKWLAMPKNRKKYENLKDAPEVVSEEIFAMTNDIVDFCKGEHGEQSHVFKKIKEEASGFFKNPAAFLKQKAEEVKKKAMEAKAMAEKKAGEAKAMAEKKAKEAAKKAKK